MLMLSLLAAARSARSAPLPRGTPRRFKFLVYLMHVCQPAVRAVSRYSYRFAKKGVPAIPEAGAAREACVKRISVRQRDVYWRSRRGKNREDLLNAFVAVAGRAGWNGVFGS